jgi:hypothetical protein
LDHVDTYDHPVPSDSPTSNAPGCRDVALVTVLLLGFAAVFVAVGLSLAGQETCTGACETLALTLLYAGGPISAMFGVAFGELVMAWPLEVTFWVVAGFLIARWGSIRGRRPLPIALVLIILALAYGLVLSHFVEIAV